MAKNEKPTDAAGIHVMDFKYAPGVILIDAEIDTIEDVDAVIGFLGRMRSEIQERTKVDDPVPTEPYDLRLAEAITEAIYKQDAESFDDSEDEDFSSVKLTVDKLDVRALAKEVVAKLAE